MLPRVSLLCPECGGEKRQDNSDNKRHIAEQGKASEGNFWPSGSSAVLSEDEIAFN